MRLWLLARTGDPVAKLLEPGFRGDAHALYARMRSQGPVYRSRTGMFATFSFESSHRILRDPRYSTCESLVRPYEVHTLTPRAYAVAVPFVESALGHAAIHVDAAARGLVRRLAHGEPFDAVEEFAFPLVVACLREVLGVPPGDSERFIKICDALSGPARGAPATVDTEAARDAREDLAALVIRLERERRHSTADDLISRLASSGARGTVAPGLAGLVDQFRRRGLLDAGGAAKPNIVSDRLGLEEIAELCQELITIGLSIAVGLIGNAIAALTAHPDQWKMVTASPRLAGKAVEETLRFDPPHQFALRVTSEEVELAGHTLPRGTGVLVMLAAAHRDVDQFAHPTRFDITREGEGDLLVPDGATGLALSLARLVGQTALWTLAHRLPELSPAGPAVRRPGGTVRDCLRMPLRAPLPHPGGQPGGRG
ncbi:cytochrome P450 [Streptomyces sp. CS227]|uniref:cytochrome P450 n=1 Tax=Streptomyces sp. CS227 TaxID=1982763 RepID=UPI0015C601E3|nr:cytochrome P450 [Streptomyces sp. CS227]